jgi:hypothetical protein
VEWLSANPSTATTTTKKKKKKKKERKITKSKKGLGTWLK